MKFSLRTLLIAAGLVMAAWALLSQACWDCWLDRPHYPPSEGNEFGLKSITSAQADFRANDRDGNGIHDFWRADVAGLYGIRHAGSQERIMLIQISGAAADARPVVDVDAFTRRAPIRGYWYGALRFADERAALDPQRFAACAFPAEYGHLDRFTFIVSHENIIWKKDLGRPGPPEVFPADPERQGWSKND